MKDFLKKKELANQAQIKANTPKFKPIINYKKRPINKREPIVSINETSFESSSISSIMPIRKGNVEEKNKSTNEQHYLLEESEETNEGMNLPLDDLKKLMQGQPSTEDLKANRSSLIAKFFV